MTIGITGPERQAPRRHVVVALLTIAIAVAISLILLASALPLDEVQANQP
jgi:uncharacterized protein